MTRHVDIFLLFYCLLLSFFVFFFSLPRAWLSGHTPKSAPAPGARLLTQFVDKQRGGICSLPSSQHPLPQVSQRPVAYTQCWPSAQGVAVRPAKHIKSTFFYQGRPPQSCFVTQEQTTHTMLDQGDEVKTHKMLL